MVIGGWVGEVNTHPAPGPKVIPMKNIPAVVVLSFLTVAILFTPLALIKAQAPPPPQLTFTPCLNGGLLYWSPIVTGVAVQTRCVDPANLLNPTVVTVPGPKFADQETPVGAVDGSNTTYSLAHLPNPTASVAVFRNGIRMTQGVDFTVNGSSVVFQSCCVLAVGEKIVADYRW